MEHKEENINETGTSQEKGALDEKDPEERQAKYWSKQIFMLMRRIVVYLFHNVFSHSFSMIERFRTGICE